MSQYDKPWQELNGDEAETRPEIKSNQHPLANAKTYNKELVERQLKILEQQYNKRK